MIISVSRRTDIPARYAGWLFGRLGEGYALTRNPMNPRQISRISLLPQDMDCMVFWSKNPQPMLDSLHKLKGYGYYFQFTLNDYGNDIEAGLPGLSQRLDTFKALAQKIGPDRVVWRYDPILLTDKYTVGRHVESFGKIAASLAGSTKKVTISFVDFYGKIANNIQRLGIRQPDDPEKHLLAKALASIAAEHGLAIDTCAEEIDLSRYGISHAACIDSRLVESITGKAIGSRRDTNQRQGCGCAASVDIGAYNSCLNGCAYCYANYSEKSVAANLRRHDPASPLLIGKPEEGDVIKDRR